jgi:hypothetical protein
MHWHTHWEHIHTIFAQARELLPPAILEDDGRALLTAYEAYRDYNELELALEDLIHLGEYYAAETTFWTLLLDAAQRMDLSETAASLLARITYHRDALAQSLLTAIRHECVDAQGFLMQLHIARSFDQERYDQLALNMQTYVTSLGEKEYIHRTFFRCFLVLLQEIEGQLLQANTAQSPVWYHQLNAAHSQLMDISAEIAEL